MKRARYFITCSGKTEVSSRLDEDRITSALIGDERRKVWDIENRDSYRQLSLFDDMHLEEENWLICDIGRKKAVIHERGRKWLLAELSSDEMERLQREGTEENWAELWKTFFTAIAIEERKNPNCQRNHLPLRFRDLMTEFQ